MVNDSVALHRAFVAFLRGDRDALDLTNMLPQLAHVHLLLNRRDAALALLREMMSGYCSMWPNQVRLDPLWSRLNDDPRFEGILKAAKPL